MIDKNNPLIDASMQMLQGIIDAQIREANSRDKTYLLVSTGSLVLSVTFVSQDGVGYLANISLLIISWLVLLCAIVLHLLSYLTVNWHFNTKLNNLRKWRRESLDVGKLPPEDNHWTLITNIFNYLSYTATIVGLVCLVIFGVSNINYMSKNENSINTNKSEGKVGKFAEPAVSVPTLSDIVSDAPISTDTPSTTTKK